MQDSHLFSVMIVDDEPAIRFGIKNAIDWTTLQCDVIALCAEGHEALRLSETLVPDIIITDIMMPGLTGLDLMREIRKSRQDTRFIILSGYDDFSYAKQAISLDVEDFLLKPLSKTELIAAIRKAVQKLTEYQQRGTLDVHDLKQSAKLLFLQQLARGEIKNEDEYKASAINFDLFAKEPPYTILTFQRQTKGMDIIYISDFIDYSKSIKADVWKQDEYQTLALLRGGQQNALHIARQYQEIMRESDLDIVIGVGETVDKSTEISRSFQKSLLALSYRIFHEHKKVFDTSDIIDTSPNFLSYNIDTLALVNILFTGTEDETIAWVKDFFQRLLYIPTPPPSYLKGMCIYLITDTIKNLMKNQHIAPSLMPNIDYAEINQLLSLSEIERWVRSTLLHIKNIVIPRSKITNDPIIFQAKKLIDDNINLNITAQEIAGRLNINFTYFSTYFKAKTGQNFRTYLNERKNDHAKKLLNDDMLSIEDIAHSLGYTDYRSFWRIFKNANGITPSEYRSRNAKGKRNRS
ncbi:MAG: response regulator [Sphaerochaetaceae bacterium]|nr:response regulator [Sphaerochaetaceae bacterium]